MGILRIANKVFAALKTTIGTGSGGRHNAPIELTMPAEPRSNPPSISLSAMMELCNSIVADTAKLFTDSHFGDAMQPEEILVFAMAIVTEVYTLGQGSAAKATPVLDGFHNYMSLLMEGRFRQVSNPALSEATINRLMDHFFELLRTRYPEYQKALRNNVWRKKPTWFGVSDLSR